MNLKPVYIEKNFASKVVKTENKGNRNIHDEENAQVQIVSSTDWTI